MQSTLVIVLSLLLPLSACAGDSLSVVTSIFPIAAIVQEVGGDRVVVKSIVEAGADPHHFELTPSQARAIHRSDLVVLIGGHFDSWVLGGLSGKADLRVVELHRAFQDSLIGGQDFNPHFWLDPLYARAMAGLVAGALCDLDPPGWPGYRARAAGFIEDIDSTHAAIARQIREAGIGVFVAAHPAWSYFARRYGLTEAGVIERSHEHEPSAKHMASLIAKIKSDDIDLIVIEEFSKPALARELARETGARIIVLDPLGGSDRTGRDTYTGLMQHNVSVLVGKAAPPAGGAAPGKR
jgi:ABC-type Zn uptake system ZnuABC Zn-binding protein ZnuA